MYRVRCVFAYVAGREHNGRKFLSNKKGSALKVLVAVYLQFFLPARTISAVQPVGAQKQPNANAAYRQLRGLTSGDNVVAVKDFTLRRDAATLTFRSGSFAFLQRGKRKDYRRCFSEGDGHVHRVTTPPTAAERQQPCNPNRDAEEFDDEFDHALLRFTDGTGAEIRKGSAGKDAADSGFEKIAQETQSFVRNHDRLDMNLDLRLLEDVLSSAPGEFFVADIHGKKNGHEFFVFDPLGVTWLAPEEVALLQWKGLDDAMAYPLAFHRAEEYANDTVSGNERKTPFDCAQEDLDVTIEKNGFLTGLASVKVTAEQDGVAVIPLNLFPTLRVNSVTNEKGDALDFIQEKKEDDSEFGVVLGQPLKSGETATLKIAPHSGKDACSERGEGNYYPVARENWYPNASQGFGDSCQLSHAVSRAEGPVQLIATGLKLSESNDGRSDDKRVEDRSALYR